jgi:alkanesulfonate monooxygenase SsuD/methylene tetrahydromethanopterin reductase-like flavin-dependent oxidoreductase (luciferase family)
MDTGVAIFPTHDAIPPADLARLAEERGHESLFFPEHTHIPASRTAVSCRAGTRTPSTCSLR